jgi:hypothetical protein
MNCDTSAGMCQGKLRPRQLACRYVCLSDRGITSRSAVHFVEACVRLARERTITTSAQHHQARMPRYAKLMRDRHDEHVDQYKLARICDANLSALSKLRRNRLGARKLSEKVGSCVVELKLLSVK